MDFATGLHLAAGLTALGLGGSAVLREPGYRRSRLFGLLCGAIALWNLGMAGELTWPALRWGRLFLMGACAAAPIGLHLAFEVTGSSQIIRHLLRTTYVLSAALWLSVWTPLYLMQPHWNLVAIALLGGTSVAALAVFSQRLRASSPGQERNALRLVMGAAVLAIGGGLSDFLPRGGLGIPKLGPAAILIFLLVLCSVVVRRRFLDIHHFLLRMVVLLIGSTAATLALSIAADVHGNRLIPLFLVTFAILAAARPLSRLVLAGAHTLLRPADPWVDALLAVSRRLQQAGDIGEVRQLVQEAGQAIPAGARVSVYHRRGAGGEYSLVFQTGAASCPRAIPLTNPLATVLERESLPVTPHYLHVESREGSRERRGLATAALEQVGSLGADLVVPYSRGDQLAGWIAVGGGRIERYVTAQVATALMALGNQAVASLDRIQATETAKRKEALAAVGEMAAGLAHEVRNPLAALRGAVRVLAAARDQEQSREMMDVIRQEGDRLARVVGEFLDYARPASPQREAVDVEALLGRVLRSARAAGVTLGIDVRVQAGVPRIFADPDQLEGAFRNLVQNAWEAAGPGGALRIEVARDGHGRVAARFEDNGPGISPEQLTRLFQPFHTTKSGGTGLGLALVHRVVEAHGGEVRVEGRPAQGAAFTVVLPSVEEGS